MLGGALKKKMFTPTWGSDPIWLIFFEMGCFPTTYLKMIQSVQLRKLEIPLLQPFGEGLSGITPRKGGTLHEHWVFSEKTLGDHLQGAWCDVIWGTPNCAVEGLIVWM